MEENAHKLASWRVVSALRPSRDSDCSLVRTTPLLLLSALPQSPSPNPPDEQADNQQTQDTAHDAAGDDAACRVFVFLAGRGCGDHRCPRAKESRLEGGHERAE